MSETLGTSLLSRFIGCELYIFLLRKTGDLVVMSIETYEAMLDENELDKEIAQAEAEYCLCKVAGCC